jgi:hypothetical protein
MSWKRLGMAVIEIMRDKVRTSGKHTMARIIHPAEKKDTAAHPVGWGLSLEVHPGRRHQLGC